jgi:hypothetical protein
MTKIILTAGELIDVVTIDGIQYFTTIGNANFEMAKIIYKGDEVLENFDIKRYTVDSTIIAVINQVDVLTDEFSNFYECVTSATILTENGFTAIRDEQ